MRRADLSGRYGDQHQKMVEISAKLRVAEKRLIEAVKIATLALQQQRRYEFSEAAPPAKTPGISQLVLLVSVWQSFTVLAGGTLHRMVLQEIEGRADIAFAIERLQLALRIDPGNPSLLSLLARRQRTRRSGPVSFQRRCGSANWTVSPALQLTLPYNSGPMNRLWRRGWSMLARGDGYSWMPIRGSRSWKWPSAPLRGVRAISFAMNA